MTRHVPADIRQPLSAARSGAVLWARCCAGQEPAEALDPRDREDLLAELTARGWTVVEIAVLTRLSSYTVARIQARVAVGAREARIDAVSGLRRLLGGAAA